MRPWIAMALLAATIPAAASAESWQEVARLPGDIAVELDADSVSTAMDGAAEVVLATFRRQMPTGTMESDLSIDCKSQAAKLRGMRLLGEGNPVYNAPVDKTADFHPIGYGSSDAIYFKALCGADIPMPGPPESDEPPADEAVPTLEASPVLEGAPPKGGQ